MPLRQRPYSPLLLPPQSTTASASPATRARQLRTGDRESADDRLTSATEKTLSEYQRVSQWQARTSATESEGQTEICTRCFHTETRGAFYSDHSGMERIVIPNRTLLQPKPHSRIEGGVN